MVNWLDIRKLLVSEYCRPELLSPSQICSLKWVADHLVTHGVLLADEVGLGKTRIAVAVMDAVYRSGGTVAAIVPQRLMHQWEGEFRKLAVALRTPNLPNTDIPKAASEVRKRHLRHYWQLFESGSKYPLVQDIPYALISHNFGLPQKLGKSSQEWRWSLPILVLHELSSNPNYRQEFRGLATRAGKKDLDEIDLAAKWLADNVSTDLRQRLRSLDLAMSMGGEPYRSIPACAPARQVYTSLIWELIGRPDLVVIDEAHKSREEENENDEGHWRKRLPLLLSGIPRRSQDRRLALTATPMEMHAQDWKAMLQRLRGSESTTKTRVDQILEFDKIREEMKEAGPSTELDVDRIVSGARSYHGSLKEVMTRRRWQDEPLMQLFRSSILPGSTSDAQVHRKWVPEAIFLDELSSNDRAAVLAAEGLTQAALGAPVSAKEKQLSARFAAGLIEDPFAEPEADEQPTKIEDVLDKAAEAKLKRVAYWRRARLRYSIDARGTVIAKLAHPRVVKAAKIIEERSKDGKVLVFGSLKEPMAALNKVLNARQHLHALEQKRPSLRPALTTDDELLFCSEQLAKELPQLNWPLSSQNLRERERIASSAYRTLERQRSALVKAVTTSLGMDKNPNAPIMRRWISQLLLERQLTSQGRLVAEEAESLVRDALEAAARDIDEEFEGAVTGDIEKTTSLNRDDVINLIASALRDEDGMTGKGTAPVQRSPFSRLLTGDTKPLTLRILQATFNQSNLNPRVVIAQARVGSEGLNLQSACKCVVLFHLDWNPARVEQQIGRVDRIASLWAHQAKEWLAGTRSDPPYIEVIALTFDGTYDQLKTQRIMERMQSMKAFLFGELLSPSVMTSMPEDWRTRVEKSAPNFSPVLCRGSSAT